jgi:hypothetical protein
MKTQKSEGLTTYLSGRISGIEEQARKEFEEAEKMLTSRGFTVINPFKLPHNHDKAWTSYMRVCIAHMMQTDTVTVLPTWTSSLGAKIEVLIAVFIDIPIFDLSGRRVNGNVAAMQLFRTLTKIRKKTAFKTLPKQEPGDGC